MMRLVALGLLVAGCGDIVAGCVDTAKCHAPVAWQPCADGTAEPGASGTPPTISSLMLPTCAFVDSPAVSGSITVSDPDGDAALIKSSLYQGVRLLETEAMLPAMPMNNYAGMLTIAFSMAKVGAYDVRIKATDRAGGQSAPLCNTITILQ
jgi:hypothetical protein